MEILGVLLGITMTVLTGAIWYGLRELKSMHGLRERIEALERRRAAITQQAGTEQAAVPVAATPRIRAWREDIGAAE